MTLPSDDSSRKPLLMLTSAIVRAELDRALALELWFHPVGGMCSGCLRDLISAAGATEGCRS
jgi:hypothetical protein